MNEKKDTQVKIPCGKMCRYRCDRVVAHIGILTKRIAMVDSISDITTAITILVRDREACLTNKLRYSRHSYVRCSTVPAMSYLKQKPHYLQRSTYN